MGVSLLHPWWVSIFTSVHGSQQSSERSYVECTALRYFYIYGKVKLVFFETEKKEDSEGSSIINIH